MWAALLALIASASCAYGAALSPAKPARLILPIAPGGSADAAARVIAQQLGAMWNQPVVVDNRPGGGTVVATSIIAKSPPDGRTFGWVIAAHAINPSLYANLPYDTLRDFAGVTLVYQLRIVIVSSRTLPANTVSELIALARSRPGGLTYATPATGSGPHLLGELFKLKHGLDMTHIGYKGSSVAHPDVISGRVPLMFDTLPGALPHIRSGKLKVIAVISDIPVPRFQELPLLPGLLPTSAATGWNGIVVPARTPKAVVASLNADIIAALRVREVQDYLASLTVEPITSTPQQFDAFIREDVGRWADVVKRAGIKLEQTN